MSHPPSAAVGASQPFGPRSPHMPALPPPSLPVCRTSLRTKVATPEYPVLPRVKAKKESLPCSGHIAWVVGEY